MARQERRVDSTKEQEKNTSQEPGSKLLSAGSISLLYGIAASLWILLSGHLLSYITTDPEKLNQLELIKGLGFVIVTTLFLYLLLRNQLLRVHLARANKKYLTREREVFFVIVILMFAVPAAGFGILNISLAPLEKAAFSDLRAITTLQFESIEDRNINRLNNLSDLSLRPEFIANIRALKEDNTSKAKTNINQHFKTMATTFGYENIGLVDQNLQPLVILTPHNPIKKEIRELALKNSIEKQGSDQAVYFDENNRNLGQIFIQPIVWDDKAPPVFIFASTSNAQEILKPIDNLPYSFETLEMFLIYEDKNKASPYILKMPSGKNPVEIQTISRRELTNLLTALPNTANSLKSKDHQGNDVIAAYTHLPDSNWLLATKIDYQEALAPAQTLAFLVSLLVFFVLLIGFIVLITVWRQQRQIFHTAIHAEESDARNKLHKQEMIYQEMFLANPHPMWIADNQTMTFLAVNAAAINHYGYSREEFMSMSEAEIQIKQLRHTQFSKDIDRHRKKDGSEISVEVSSRRLKFQNKDARLVIAYDVTEREYFQEKLQESERFALSIIDSLVGHISVLDESGTIIATNKGWRDFSIHEGANLRYTDKGANYFEVCQHAAMSKGDGDAAIVLKGLKMLMAGSFQHFHHEYPCHSPTEKRWFAVHLTRFQQGGHTRIVAFHENITTRRMAEEDLKTINRYYAALSAMNGAIIRARDPDDLVNEVCKIAVTHNPELKLVCARKLEKGVLVSSSASQGHASQLASEAFFEYNELENIEHSEEPCAVAISEERPVAIGDIVNHKQSAQWASSAKKHGLKSALLCPIVRRNDTWGVLMFFADQTNYFRKELVDLLSELTADLAYSLDMLDLEQKRREIEAKLLLNAKIIESSKEGIFITDKKNHITMVNPSVSTITGYESDELLGQNPRILNSGYQTLKFYKDFWYRLQHTGHWEGEIWDRRKDGEVFPVWMSVTRVADPTSDNYHHIAIYQDITERKKHETYIEHMATHDILTDLPNRSVLQERASLTIAQASRHDSIIALLFIDLDRFKLINDTLGHEIGDQVLKAIAKRIAGVLRESDTISRVGGDEFVAVLSNVRSKEDVSLVANKIIYEVTQPINIEQHSLVVTASIGISLYPEHGRDVQGLMRIADIAMMTAKQSGQDRYHFYAGEMGADVGEHLTILNALRSATDKGQIFLVYQPQIDLRNKRVVGIEALTRWQHPDFGLVTPDQFIPLAEDSGIIISLGNWIMREACRQTQDWRVQGILDVPVSVNVSTLQFRQEDFVERVRTILAETGLPAEKLELEVTESLLIVNVKNSLAKIKELQEMGIFVAIDDFGTGYSSMSYLRQLSFNRLKIDKSFIDDIPNRPDAVAIVRAIISLGAAVGTTVIAEGVETDEQADFLSSIWCSQAQGYLFARPMPGKKLEYWLETRPE